MTGRASIKRDVARRCVETIFNQKRTEALDGFMVPDVVLHHSGRAGTPVSRRPSSITERSLRDCLTCIMRSRTWWRIAIGWCCGLPSAGRIEATTGDLRPPRSR